MKSSEPQEPIVEEHREGYTISTDPARLDVAAIHNFLHNKSYWSPGIPISIVERSLNGSLCFGMYRGTEQIGFARVITDRATFAYLADVYVLEQHQRRRLGTWLMQIITGHPSLQGLRRFVLATRDAHRLYEEAGFRPVRPNIYMEIHRPHIYQQTEGAAYSDTTPAADAELAVLSR